MGMCRNPEAALWHTPRVGTRTSHSASQAYFPWTIPATDVTMTAAGFAAMHRDAVLVHGDDIARGLGVACTPPPDLVRHVRDRLFPWTPAGDPSTTLLWCNGRVALPDHARLSDWLWHPVPLSAWDSTRRRRERCKAGRERLTTCDAQA